MSEKLLVTGASGKLGRAVVRHLLETEKVAPGAIIATTREPSKLADLASLGVDVRAADFDDRASLDTAFRGAGRLIIISAEDIVTPGRRLRQHQTAVAAAAAAGANHIVYTSMPQPEPGSLIPFAGDHYGTEQAIKETGASYTILRNAWYMDNYFMALPQALAVGQWYTATGQGRAANVSRDDCARAIAAVLASGVTESATYTLTGPEAFTTDQVAALVAEISGRPLSVVHVNDEQLAGGMKAAGVPDGYVPILVAFDANTREGRMDIVTNDVEKLTGRPPKTLRAFLEENRTAFAGEPEAALAG